MSDISADLVEQVKEAVRLGRPLQIAGGGSKSHLLGRDIRAKNYPHLSLNEHRGIVSYEPSELVLTARAGTTIAEIESALAEHGQVLSFEPPQFEGATYGVREGRGGYLKKAVEGQGDVEQAMLGVLSSSGG